MKVWARVSHAEGTLKGLACERKRQEVSVTKAQGDQGWWPEVWGERWAEESPWRALLDMEECGAPALKFLIRGKAICYKS